MSLEIRKYKESDFDSVHRFITNTWYADAAKEDPAVAHAFVTVDVNSHLHNSSFGLTAELDGEVVGVFFGFVVDHPKEMRLFERDIVPELQKFFETDTELSENLIKSINEEHQANDQLNENLKDPYQGQIQLFIVDSSKRGQNVGGTLWNAGQKIFEEAGVERFILHTDTDCDYGFYDAKGLDSLDPVVITDDEGNESIDYMLYHGEVEKEDE